MVSHEAVESVLLPDHDVGVAYLQEHRWAEGVHCPACGSEETIKRGSTRKDVQRYWCHGCEREFNDLTGTIFAEHKLSLPEMFHIVAGMKRKTTAELTRELDRTYKTVLEFVHEVQDAAGSEEFVLSGIAEADEVYVTAGEKGEEQEVDEPRERGRKKRDAEPSTETNRPS